MGRDPRKGAAFASGMRGREKPTIADAHGRTMGEEDTGTAGGEKKQVPMGHIGNPDGVDHTDPVYSSGMRGLETGKQKRAQQGRGGSDAQYGQTDHGAGGGESKQGPDKQVGNPDGDNTVKRGQTSGVADSHMQSTAKDAHDLGIPGNNTEQASQGEPLSAEEDDTHINIRVPKSSIAKRKGAGQAV